MNEIQPYAFRGNDVRVVVVDEEPWFVASDVAKVLGYREAYYLTRGLDDEDKGPHIVRTPGGDQQMTVINESGLYAAILGSRIQSARDFKRWVTSEVLPSIRKTGSYGTPAGLTFEEMTAQVITELNRRIEAAQSRAAELESPAKAWTDLSSAEGDFTVSDAAKILARSSADTGPRKLFTYLQANGWLFHRGGRWQAMQSAVNAGLVVERITSGYFDQETGERKQGHPQVRITPAGLERLRELLEPERSLALVGDDFPA